MKTILKFAFGFAVGFVLVSQAFAIDLSLTVQGYTLESDGLEYKGILGAIPTNGLFVGTEFLAENIGMKNLSVETEPCQSGNMTPQFYNLLKWFWRGNTYIIGGGYQTGCGSTGYETPKYAFSISQNDNINNWYIQNGNLTKGYEYTFCMYDTWTTGSQYIAFRRINYGNSCDETAEGKQRIIFGTAGVQPPLPPTTSPELSCSKKLVNTLSGATWYNMGELAYNFNKSYTGVIWQQFTDVNTGKITDADNIRFTLVNDIGSDMPIGSIAWSGSTTNAYLSGDGELQIRATRDNAPLAFNTVQFGGIASGGNSVRVRYQYLNGDYHEGISYLSGSILTISTPQLSKGVFVSNLGRFRGIRVGVAQQETKTFCGIAGSSCGWKMVGTENSCVPIQLSGIQLSSGGCYITSSTSVYGSGACVPTVNGSGAIIPHTVLGQSSAYYNSSGAIVGIVNTGQIPDISFYDQVFNCGFDYENDSWYTTVAKALTCPVTVVKNLFVTSYTSVKEVSEGFQKIQNAVSQISTATGVTQNDSDTGMNPIFSSLKDKTDFIKNNDGSYVGKMVKFVYWSMIVMTILMLLGIIVYLLKKK